MKGFSVGPHYNKLLGIGKTLKNLYECGNFYKVNSLDAQYLNAEVFSRDIYFNNYHSQRENFETFIVDLYNQSLL